MKPEHAVELQKQMTTDQIMTTDDRTGAELTD
jgi:hypothetical protein